jgi:hypothetical protein
MPLEAVDNEREHGSSLVSVCTAPDSALVHGYEIRCSIMNDWWPSVIEDSAKPWVWLAATGSYH